MNCKVRQHPVTILSSLSQPSAVRARGRAGSCVVLHGPVSMQVTLNCMSGHPYTNLAFGLF